MFDEAACLVGFCGPLVSVRALLPSANVMKYFSARRFVMPDPLTGLDLARIGIDDLNPKYAEALSKDADAYAKMQRDLAESFAERGELEKAQAIASTIKSAGQRAKALAWISTDRSFPNTL